MQQNKSEIGFSGIEFKEFSVDRVVVADSGKELEFVIKSNAYFYLGKDGGIEIYTIEEDMSKVGIPSLKLCIIPTNPGGNGRANPNDLANKLHAVLSAAYEKYEVRERAKKDAYFASLLKS